MNKSSATQFCFKDTKKNERKKERHAFRDSYKILKVENIFLLLSFGHDNYLILRTELRYNIEYKIKQERTAQWIPDSFKLFEFPLHPCSASVEFQVSLL